MPSERRLHPATLFFELFRHAKNFAFPALAVAFGASRGSGAMWGGYGIPTGFELWLPLLIVPAAAASLARYLTFRLRFTEDEMIVRSGLLFRSERHIPFSRIQNVDAVENLFHRLFGVIEVRVETGGGQEEEARLSVLPRAALDDIRGRVFRQAAEPAAGEEGAAPAPEGRVLLHLPLREVALYGLLENKGLVIVGAAYGVLWETGFLDRLFGLVFRNEQFGRGLLRDVAAAFFADGAWPLARLAWAAAGLGVFLILVRVLSVAWALLTLYDFRLTRIREDLRSDYGLFTRVTATVPIRRVQTIHVSEGPLHRWLGRAAVRVETAGGGGGSGSGGEGATPARAWLAPLIHRDRVPALLQDVLPGVDLDAFQWQPVHPRAFQRAMKPVLIFIGVLTAALTFTNGWLALAALVVVLPWMTLATRKQVQHLGWVEGDEVVVMKSGWIWRQLTVARINKIQAVAMHQSPFDRRAAMARVRVDTAGAGELAHRVDIPYLDHTIARGLADRLSAAAASTAFRW
jgi:putative membrane protein